MVSTWKIAALPLALGGFVYSLYSQTVATTTIGVNARDPGVRGGPAAAGLPFTTLSAGERVFFNAGSVAFQEIDSVQGTIPDTEAGLGPTFNLDTCGGCHAQPAVGGTSPALNPQIAVASKNGANNRIPSFISADGPVREARFKQNPDGSRDGGVHGLFTIAGRQDAPGCTLAQPNFAAAVSAGNVVFRIPTPLFGSGLIEAITDAAILDNKNNNSDAKRFLGISGRENRNGNDGTITRFGWKAQNKSLMIFAGEAYNVEQGITNELFPTDRAETPGCRFVADPESTTGHDAAEPAEASSDLVLFSDFMRFLAPPKPAPDTPSIVNGRNLFSSAGCAFCHTPSLQTGNAGSPTLRNQPANLYSDLLLHNMGSRLADGIFQGEASGSEFRTAPLWGLGQRIFFLHDGRTKDLEEAINAHSSQGSEANRVVDNFNNLRESQKQDVLNFLRSL
jgi:CxxC motif-containing protein (DUF1111 family)